MEPIEELLINFGDDTEDIDVFTSRNSKRNSTNSELNFMQEELQSTSSLYQPFWREQGKLMDGFNSSFFSPLNGSPIPPNLSEEKEVLIKKIIANQEVLRRKLNDLRQVKESFTNKEKELSVLNHYIENLLASKAVRNIH